MIGKIRDLLTFEGLAYAIYDYPEMVEDMVETVCVLTEQFLDQVLGEGKKAIAKYMESLVPLVERGGYIPFCDHRCPPNVKQEDYMYYLDLKEKTFGMK